MRPIQLRASWLTCSTIGLALATSACTLEQSAPDPGELQSPIVGGVLDTGDPAIVEFADACTAEVISPHVLITAAHCVTPAPKSKYMVIFTGPDDSEQSGGVTVQVEEVHAHPGYNAKASTSIHDVGVVILQKPVTIKPLPLNRTPLTNAMKGQPVRIVGYGTTQANGADQGFGQRRQATSPLISFDDNWVNVGTSTANQCFGDSGGPALMMIGGQEVIVGVDSIGTDSGNTCQKYNSDTRIDEELAFIDPFVVANDPGSVVGAGGGSGADAGGAAGSGGKNAAAGEGGNAGAEGGAANAGGPSGGGPVNGTGGSVNSDGGATGSAGGSGSNAGGDVNSGGALNSGGATSGNVSGGPSIAGVAGSAVGAVDANASGNASEGCTCSVVGGAAPTKHAPALVLALGSIWALRRRRRELP
jgi:MYXO-CTERM domain-containing protein